jgi:hypothetical protein
MGSTCGTDEGEDKCFRVFVGRAERRRPLKEPCINWRITKMDLRMGDPGLI